MGIYVLLHKRENRMKYGSVKSLSCTLGAVNCKRSTKYSRIFHDPIRVVVYIHFPYKFFALPTVVET